MHAHACFICSYCYRPQSCLYIFKQPLAHKYCSRTGDYHHAVVRARCLVSVALVAMWLPPSPYTCKAAPQIMKVGIHCTSECLGLVLLHKIANQVERLCICRVLGVMPQPHLCNHNKIPSQQICWGLEPQHKLHHQRSKLHPQHRSTGRLTAGLALTELLHKL